MGVIIIDLLGEEPEEIHEQPEPKKRPRKPHPRDIRYAPQLDIIPVVPDKKH